MKCDKIICCRSHISGDFTQSRKENEVRKELISFLEFFAILICLASLRETKPVNGYNNLNLLLFHAKKTKAGAITLQSHALMPL